MGHGPVEAAQLDFQVAQIQDPLRFRRHIGTPDRQKHIPGHQQVMAAGGLVQQAAFGIVEALFGIAPPAGCLGSAAIHPLLRGFDGGDKRLVQPGQGSVGIMAHFGTLVGLRHFFSTVTASGVPMRRRVSMAPRFQVVVEARQDVHGRLDGQLFVEIGRQILLKVQGAGARSPDGRFLPGNPPPVRGRRSTVRRPVAEPGCRQAP